MPRLSALHYAILTTALIFIIDHLVGQSIRLGIYYLFPVMFATWARGIRFGAAWALLGVALSYLTAKQVGHPFANDTYLFVELLGQWIAMIVAALLATYAHRAHAELRGLARIDFLTGVGNRMAFHEAAERHIHLNSRGGVPFALLYLDCDNFKRVNDLMGHTEGDRLLVLIARTLTRNTRRSDSIARLGGDEFAVLLHSVDATAVGIGNSIQEKLHAALSEAGFTSTVSIGVAVFTEAPRSAADALGAADALMYQVKNAGKGQVIVRHIDRDLHHDDPIGDYAARAA